MPDLVDFSGEDLFGGVVKRRSLKPVSSLTHCDKSEDCSDYVKADHSYFCLNEPKNCPVKRNE